jgi:hypothetical protein
MRFFRARLFCCEKKNQEIRNPGKEIPFFLLSLFNFFMSDRNGQVPNSKKTCVPGKLHPDIRVPFFVIPSEVENRAARDPARWTGRPEVERAGSKRIKSLEISVRL